MQSTDGRATPLELRLRLGLVQLGLAPDGSSVPDRWSTATQKILEARQRLSEITVAH